MPESLNLNYLLTAESKRRKFPRLKGLYEKIKVPGLLQLAGGTPNSSIFPFDGVGTTTLSPPFCHGVTENKMNAEMPIEFQIFENLSSGSEKSGNEDCVTQCDMPKPEVAQSGYEDIELAVSLQYGSAMGNDRLRDFLRRHHSQYMSSPAFDDWDLMLSIGNTFAWDAVLRTFCEPSDTVFFEEFTFPSALENCQTRGCTTIGVKLETDGIEMADLEHKLKLHRPKLLYTIPTGQNPTGTVMSVKKRKQLMQLACKYDFLVVEDDPYYYLQMPNFSQGDGVSLVPSLLHYDLEGRCIRLDSFSKVFAPGIRMGWITAQTRFLEAIRATCESSSSKPSGFAESLVNGVLQRWGNDGFLIWLQRLQQEYQVRRDRTLCAFEAELNKLHAKDVTSRIRWNPPDAGMFFWVEISGLPQGKSSRVLEEELFEYLADSKNVLVVPGHWCQVDEEEELSSIYLRVTFASASHEELAKGGAALAHGIVEFLQRLASAS